MATLALVLQVLGGCHMTGICWVPSPEGVVVQSDNDGRGYVGPARMCGRWPEHLREVTDDERAG